MVPSLRELSLRGQSQEAGFTQPRHHSFAQPCAETQTLLKRNISASHSRNLGKALFDSLGTKGDKTYSSYKILLSLLTAQSASDTTGTLTALRTSGEDPPEERVPQPDTRALLPASQSWPWLGIVTVWSGPHAHLQVEKCGVLA